MTRPKFNTDREALRALTEFLTYEQNVTAAMTAAYDAEDLDFDEEDVDQLKAYINVLAIQIGDAWKMASDYLAATETDIAE